MSISPAREALDWVLALTGEPADDVVTDRFSSGFLKQVPVDRLRPLLPQLVDDVRDQLPEMTVREVDAYRLVATLGDTEIVLGVATQPPHTIGTLLFRQREVVVTDSRLVNPPTSNAGPVDLAEVARKHWDKGMVGLSVHLDDNGTASAMTIGWADLAAGRALTADEAFPAYSITKLLTTVGVLQLVAAGEVDLDAPAADRLTTLTLPRDITVRHLLTHHGAVSSAFEHWADEVPDLVDVLGWEVAVLGPPGAGYEYSNGGFAVLGQLIADVVGQTYPEVMDTRILQPLGMTASWFPMRVQPEGVVLHEVAEGGLIEVPDRKVSSIFASGGLWSTAADLAVFARDWATLLPEELATAALTPQAPRSDSQFIGLGFLLGGQPDRRVVGHTGGGVGASTSLLLMPDDGLAAITLSNRRYDVEPISFDVLRAGMAASG